MNPFQIVGTWLMFLLPTFIFVGLWLAVWPAFDSGIFWQGFGFGILTGVYAGIQTMLLLFGKQSKYL